MNEKFYKQAVQEACSKIRSNIPKHSKVATKPGPQASPQTQLTSRQRKKWSSLKASIRCAPNKIITPENKMTCDIGTAKNQMT